MRLVHTLVAAIHAARTMTLNGTTIARGLVIGMRSKTLVGSIGCYIGSFGTNVHALYMPAWCGSPDSPGSIVHDIKPSYRIGY